MKYPNDLPVVLTYGGGTNSSAILVELIKRGYEPPALIIFADTGAEMPHTYEHIKVMSEYSIKHGYPEIITVRSEQSSKEGGLYEMSLRNRVLPSVAYGYKNCSVQFKIEPVERFIKNVFDGNPCLKIVGYDADETQRAESGIAKNTSQHTLWFPLIEWGMGRDECIKSVLDTGLPRAGKSHCFMCPNTKPSAVRELAQRHPELAQKAITLEEASEKRAIEQGKTGAIIGLGRNWMWKDLIATDDMFGFTDLNRDMPCGCFDGGE